MLLVSLFCLPGTAEEYRIADQSDFDRLRNHTFQAGDRILFKKGETFEGQFAPSGSGRSGSPIILSTYGDGPKPVIHARGQHQAALFLKNVEYWEVHGIEVTNTDGGDDDQGDLKGIYVRAENPEKKVLRHVYIRNCFVHDVNGKVAGKRRGGIHVHVRGDTPARFHDVQIINNKIKNVGGVGIGNDSPFASPPDDENPRKAQYWRDVLVRGNFVDHTGRNNIIARCSRNAVYEHNVLANSSRYSTGHSIFCFDTIGIRIQYNEAYGNVGEEGQDRGAFDADWNCRNTFIQYNYSHDNMWFCGIMKRWNKGVTIRYNVSVNDRKGIYFYGFDDASGANDIHVYNNTHYFRNGLEPKIFVEGRKPLNTRFENNLFIFEGSGSYGSGFDKRENTVFNNNLYYGIEPSEGDQNAVTANPKFLNPGRTPEHLDWSADDLLPGYQLHPDSPAINRGIQIPDNGGQDFRGHPLRDRMPDIGAYERTQK